MLGTVQNWGRLVTVWRVGSRAQEHLVAAQSITRHFSTDPPEQPSDGDTDAEGGVQGVQAAAGAADAPVPDSQNASASGQLDAASSVHLEAKNSEPVVEDTREPLIPRHAYNPLAPAASNIHQHFADTVATHHTVLNDHFLDEEGSSESPTAEVERRLSPLDAELRNAVNDQYGQFGVTVEDLRTYLDVSLDIDDAISVGRKPSIQQDRYRVYKRIDKLIKFGPDKSPEEAERLDRMAEDEMLDMPWPSTMVREYVKKKNGVKLKRMRKDEQTQYDQGWMTESLFPFESEQDMASEFTQKPDPMVISSYWADELDEDGNVQRKPQRMVGTDDLSDWAQAVAAAMITPADTPAVEFSQQGAAGAEGDEAVAAEAAQGASAGAAVQGEQQEGVYDDYAATGPILQFPDGRQYRQPDALGALLEAKFGEDKLFGLPEDERKRLNKMAAGAITDAVFKEQEATILRSHGYSTEQRDEFISELGMSENDWQEWVTTEVMHTVERLGNVQMDDRSPQDMIEELVASHSKVAPWMGPANDMRDVVASHPIGPLSDYYIMPEFMREREDDRHPASSHALWDSVIEGSKSDYIYPEIFHFDQKIILHMGDRPYHPANRRVTLRVRIQDLQIKYGLSDEALIHIVSVAGKRYNPNSGMISISCDIHRAREENRRQALHWALRLVESGLRQHPSEEWESVKALQLKALADVDEPAPCPFASFMDMPEEPSGSEAPGPSVTSAM